MATEIAAPLASRHDRLKIFLHALLFVAGFSLVFIVGWGGSVTLVGKLFGSYKQVIAQIGGIVVIMFGLATLEVIRIPWFYADTRIQYTGQRGTYGGSALMGIFFAAGWSPCIGATLGAILTMGLSQQTVGQAMWLASGYSLGLGIPFLALGLGLERATGWIKRVRRYRRAIQLASGTFIIIIGVLLLTNMMRLISIWAFKNGYYIEAFAAYAAAPTYLTAIIAGLLSFISPCVLPLVPAYLGYLSGHTLQKRINMKRLILISLVAVVLAGCQSKSVTGETVTTTDGSYQNITPAELNMMLKNKDFLFVNVHIPFAGNIAETDLSIAYDQITDPVNLAQLPADKNAKIILYCRSGRMSPMAAEDLVKLGYTNIWNLNEGMGWMGTGWLRN